MLQKVRWFRLKPRKVGIAAGKVNVNEGQLGTVLECLGFVNPKCRVSEG